MLQRAPDLPEIQAALRRVRDERSAEEVLESAGAPEPVASGSVLQRWLDWVRAGGTGRIWALAAAVLLVLAPSSAFLLTRSRHSPPVAMPPLDLPSPAQPAEVPAETPTLAPRSEPELAHPKGDTRRGTVYPVIRNRRKEVGRVFAPFAGTAKLGGTEPRAVSRGEAVAMVEPRTLLAPGSGWLVPMVANNAAVREGQPLAAVLEEEVSAQAVVKVAPGPWWVCEVLDGDSGKTARCRVTHITRRKKGYAITLTTQPLWFDKVPMPRVRLSPP
jgi:hypothetical protein